MSVMIFGTASHVGKSTIAAGILRLLIRRGISCAPFKSQNMSLNSWITEDGDEIGIAQAMQAHAARCPPSALMNPVLLKPKGKHSSQVILLGKPYLDTSAETYFTITPSLLPHCLTAAQTLTEQYTNLVIEGAGSVAELNLYERDIANIGIARALQYPIILVADIERGGVFAQVYGTISLLPPDIKPLVQGVIINKFQGDPALFTEGIAILEKLCHVPVLGVVPYIHLDIPDEDSLSLRDRKVQRRFPSDAKECVRIAIIRLPYISNFTDYALLESDPHAFVSYVLPGEDLAEYDAIILPGTKNTICDLRTLQETGTADAIIAAAKRGVVIIGICGGYQMLGCALHDSGVEEQEGVYKGLGLLPCITVFDSYEKITTQVTRTSSGFGPVLSRMDTVFGYEIHMGITKRVHNGCENALCADVIHSAFEDEGTVSDSGLVIGTYLHGLFTNQNAASALISYLCEEKGHSYTKPEPPPSHADPYDTLADHLELHLDIQQILRHFEY